jgi:hypothetical protein
MAAPVQGTPSDIIWPSLPVAAWQDTYETLHMWTQIVGKIRLALAPKLNHWWHSTLYVTPRGLTTSSIPYGTRTFEISFDFLEHYLQIEISDGTSKRIALESRSVASFYQEVMSTLSALGLEVRIWTMPQEVASPIPFDEDRQHATYDPEYAQQFWRILVQADRVMTAFRSRFIGKCSPAHFFWGSCDPSCDPLFWTPSPRASRRDSWSGGLGDATGIFAPSEQLWLLARWWSGGGTGFLRLRLPSTGGVSRLSYPASSGIL